MKSSLIAMTLTAVLSSTALADQCTADADYKGSSAINEWKHRIKFRVSSDDCKEYGCSGHIQYRIHFDYRTGGSNSQSDIVSYRIPRGQHGIDVITERSPGGSSNGSVIKDVEVGEVSCSAP